MVDRHAAIRDLAADNPPPPQIEPRGDDTPPVMPWERSVLAPPPLVDPAVDEPGAATPQPAARAPRVSRARAVPIDTQDTQDTSPPAPPPSTGPAAQTGPAGGTDTEEVVTAEPSDQDRLPGMARGGTRLLSLTLSPLAAGLLRDAARGCSLGTAAMEAMRSSYEHLLELTIPRKQGSFPAPLRVVRVRRGERFVATRFNVSIPESQAIKDLCEHTGRSQSELFTLAIEHHFGPSAANEDVPG